MLPVAIDLKTDGANPKYELETTTRRFIRGTARWRGGGVVPGLEIKAYAFHTPHSIQFGKAIDIDVTKTDESGAYQLRIPHGLMRVKLSADGVDDAVGNFHSAFGRLGDNDWEEQAIEIGDVQADIEGADWKVRSEPRLCGVDDSRLSLSLESENPYGLSFDNRRVDDVGIGG